MVSFACNASPLASRGDANPRMLPALSSVAFTPYENACCHLKSAAISEGCESAASVIDGHAKVAKVGPRISKLGKAR
jgi:hypothetical protein